VNFDISFAALKWSSAVSVFQWRSASDGAWLTVERRPESDVECSCSSGAPTLPQRACANVILLL